MRALIIALAVSSLVLTGCGSSKEKEATSSGLACSYPSAGTAAKDVGAPPTKAETRDVKATITLDSGAVPITLHGAEAPCTVNSFLSLAKQGYFDGSTCHRLVTSGIFVLQCGDPSGSGRGGPGYSFADELSTADRLAAVPNSEARVYPAGTLAMANAVPDANGSQFFMVFEDSPLPPRYTVFGTVSDDGLQVVKAIADKGTADGSSDGAPKEPVTIRSVTIRSVG